MAGGEHQALAAEDDDPHVSSASAARNASFSSTSIPRCCAFRASGRFRQDADDSALVKRLVVQELYSGMSLHCSELTLLSETVPVDSRHEVGRCRRPDRLRGLRRRQPHVRDQGGADAAPAGRVQERHRLRRGAGPHEDRRSRARSASTSPTRRSTSSPARAPRRSTSATATRRARATGSSSASRCAAIPAFREPGPRLELMDELGVDRSLMFPTLASLVEERLRDDLEATHAVIHALNEWMHETWTFDYEDRIFADADHHPSRSSTRPSRSSSGASSAAPRPCSSGPRRCRSRAAARPRRACEQFDPFWERVVELGIPVSMHASRQRLRPLRRRLGGRQRVPAVQAQRLPLRRRCTTGRSPTRSRR